MTTSDMLTHSWILTESVGQDQKQQQQKLKLTLRELLSVSSDWKDVNKKNAGAGAYSTSGAGGGGQNSGLPIDFQSQQIERIVEATDLSYPGSIKYLLKLFKKYNIDEILKLNGVKEGDLVEIGGKRFEWV